MRFPLRTTSTDLIAVLSCALLFVSAQLPAQIDEQDWESRQLRPVPVKTQRLAADRLDSQLYRIQRKAEQILGADLLARIDAGEALDWTRETDLSTFETKARAHGMRVDRHGRINVEVFGPEGSDGLSMAWAESQRLVYAASWRNLTELWVPVGSLAAVAGQLPQDYFMQPVLPLNFDHHAEGPIVVNSASYRDGGADGSGITIAIIDGGYVDLINSENSGHAPTGSQVEKLTCNPICVSNSGPGFVGESDHGTGCVEAAFSHASGANFRLYTISGLTQIALAVADAIDHGANIISHSLSHYNQGWEDGTGTANAIAGMAANANALFFTSAGNRARRHWQGVMSPNAGGAHRFLGDDTTIELSFGAGGRANFYLQWDTSSGVHDYDLYLYNQDLIELRRSDNGGNTFEAFHYHNQSEETQTLHLRVVKVAGANVEFELFMHGFGPGWTSDFQYQVRASSITSPSNSLDANVISVGAVDKENHESGNGEIGIIASYSSRGPSNSGATKPDFVGPTDTSTNCCEGSFGGTSSATPNNAGAAATLWSAHPDWSASAVRWMMFEKARRYKDWGDPGKDNIYGWGGSFLVDFIPNTTWLAGGYGNNTNLPTGPYSTLSAAYSAAEPSGTILMISHGGYPDSFQSGDKGVTLRSIVPTVLGSP